MGYHGPVVRTIGTECQVGVGRKQNVSAPLPAGQSGMSRGVVIGVNNCLYERALAIGCDVTMVSS